jgi:hypothetical protein
MLLRVILTPPARYQHPHDTSNPPVGHWGNCKPKWWPQGSTFSSSKTKQRTYKAKRGELNGLVVYADVRIGLSLYSSSCSTRYGLNLLLGKKCPLKKCPQKEIFRKDTTKRGHQRELARKGRPHSQLWVPICGGMSTADARGNFKKKKKGSRSVVFWSLFSWSLFSFSFFWRPLGFPRFYFIVFLSFLLQNAQKRDLKKSSKTTEGGKKKPYFL